MMRHAKGFRRARTSALVATALAAALAPTLAVGCKRLDPNACRSDPLCASEGRCGARNYRAGDTGLRCFVDSEASCAASAACRDTGACHFAPEIDPESCVATSAADCSRATACRERGLCTLGERGRCVATEAGCRRGASCERDHDCSVYRDRCSGTNADETTWCNQPCSEEGACERRGTLCVATSDERCRASYGCRLSGRCSVDPAEGMCVARTDEDCLASRACVVGTADAAHLCALRGSACVDPRPACERSADCLLGGDCHAVDGICAPTSDDDCARSIQCKTQGRCKRDGAICVVGSASDCRQSLECGAYGRCDLRRFLGKECVRPGEKDVRWYACRDDACTQEGRCMRRTGDVCETPRQAGLDVDLPVLPPPPPPPPPAPPPLSVPPVDGRELAVLVDGKRLVVTHALAARRAGEQSVTVILSDGPLSCPVAVALDAVPGQTILRLVVSPLLVPPSPFPKGSLDGLERLAWGVTSARWWTSDVVGSAGFAGFAQATDDFANEGEAKRLRLSVRYSRLTSKAPDLTLAGTVPVVGCGVLESAVPSRPQTEVTLTVARKTWPIRAAVIVRALEAEELWLGTAPLGCDVHRSSPADVLAVVTLGAGSSSRLSVAGDRMPYILEVGDGIARVDPPDRDGAQPVFLGFAPPSDPRVELHGRVHALRCR